MTDARWVALLLPYGVFGAAEDYMVILANGLAARGWRVSVVHPQSMPMDESGRRGGWEPIAIPDDVMVSARILSKHLRRLIKPDIVHVNQIVLPSIAAGALMRESALVVTAHNPALAHHYSLKGRLLNFMIKDRPGAWIVLSDRNMSLLATRHVRRRSIHVVPPGLPVSRFDAPLASNVARRTMRLPVGAFTVGTVGRLALQKRHDVLIRALSTLTNAIPELHMAILGDGELRDETERVASELLPGRVTFVGHRVDVPQLLRAFDVFAMSSDFEGLPFALLEAMATGRAIVTTDVQGAGEAVRDRQEGLVVPRRDPDALAAAILSLAKDKELAERLGRAARVRFLAEFTAERMVDRTEALYLRLLETRKRRH